MEANNEVLSGTVPVSVLRTPLPKCFFRPSVGNTPPNSPRKHRRGRSAKRPWSI